MSDKEEKKDNYFKNFLTTDISKHVVEKKIPGMKKVLSYLSWAHAWEEIKKADLAATFEVLRFDNNLPYVFDPNTGYMVFTKVTTFGSTLSCFLPVMNGANKAMKNAPYQYKAWKYNKEGTKEQVTKQVEAASMMDINKTIMRCLVKNIALHGLGLSLYTGEDLNNGDDQSIATSPVCPHCKSAMYTSKFPDKVSGAGYTYCAGKYNAPPCKYSAWNDGVARTDITGAFIKAGGTSAEITAPSAAPATSNEPPDYLDEDVPF